MLFEFKFKNEYLIMIYRYDLGRTNWVFNHLKFLYYIGTYLNDFLASPFRNSKIYLSIMFSSSTPSSGPSEV